MRLLRRIFFGLVVIVLAAAATSYILPRHVIVEREMVMNAPPEVIFQHVNSLRAFSEWSPWGGP